jgi:hypothetical protein
MTASSLSYTLRDMAEPVILSSNHFSFFLSFLLLEMNLSQMSYYYLQLAAFCGCLAMILEHGRTKKSILLSLGNTSDGVDFY